jgi:hypothetical protein
MRMTLPILLLVHVLALGVARGASVDEMVLTATVGDFYLGATYDSRSDQLIPGLSPWSQYSLSEFSSQDIPMVNMHVLLDESIENKFAKMDISAELQVSIMSGLVEVSGSGEYLKETSTDFHSLSFSLVYKSTSRFEHLDMDHFANTQYEDAFDDKALATHVVSGIEYGADYVVKFTTTIQSGEDKESILGKLSARFENIPGVSISGSASVQIDTSSTSYNRHVAVTCMGELTLDGDVTCPKDVDSLEDFLTAVSRCKPGQCGSVPKKIYLYPLSKLSDNAGKLVKQMKDDLINYAVSVLGDLNEKLAYLQGVSSWNLGSTTLLSVQSDADTVFQELNIVKIRSSNVIAQSIIQLRNGTLNDTKLTDTLTRVKRFLFLSNIEAWSKTQGKLLSQLGPEILALESEVGGVKSTFEMSISAKKSSWLVLFVNLDNSYPDKFINASETFMSSIEAKTPVFKSLTPWNWSDASQTQAGKNIKLFRQLMSLNSNMSTENGFNVIVNRMANPSNVIQFAVYDGDYKFINPIQPSNFTFISTNSSLTIDWDPIPGIWGYSLVFQKPGNNVTLFTATAWRSIYDVPAEYAMCDTCKVQICALFTRTICGPYSGWKTIPRYVSPIITQTTEKTPTCVSMLSKPDPSTPTNASLLSRFDISCPTPSQVLTGWTFTSDNCGGLLSSFRFKYGCGKINSSYISSTFDSYSTNCAGYLTTEISNFTWHNVSCPGNSLMREWKVNIDKCPTGFWNVDYQCYPVRNILCKKVETYCSTMNHEPVPSLGGQDQVQCPSGWLMQGFQLQHCDGDNMNFAMTCCQFHS